MKKILSLVLALAMVLSLCACGSGDNPESQNPSQPSTPVEGESQAPGNELGEFVPVSYNEDEVYNNALGDFYTAFMNAKGASSVSERYALMAVAEAKMLESGVMIPMEGVGGNYAISSVVPRTVPTIMYGSDNDRTASIMVVDKIMKAEDRKAVTALWAEKAGTGEFEEAVKTLLTEQGYTLKDEYNRAYTSDPSTWDVLATWQSAQSEPATMVVDGLVGYDMENVLQPLLAESYEVSDDGLTWTFHIRPNVPWVDSQGRQVDTVKADDWVAALQHCADCGGGAANLMAAVEGMPGYLAGEITDFSQVGVTAIDDLTLEYKLTEEVPYFLSMLTYNGLGSPLCRSYYVSRGGKFGAEFAADAADYDYGKDANKIAYCGPFLVTNWTEKNTIVFEANPTYWNPDELNVHKVTWKYTDGTDVLKLYTDYINRDIDSCGLVAERLEQAKQDGNFDDYAYVASNDGGSYVGYWNLNRIAYANYNDQTKCVSPQNHGSVDEIDLDNEVYTSEVLDDAARTHAAMNNKNFRLAMTFATDRSSYRAQANGDELKLAGMRNSFVPGTFVSLEEEVTLDIGTFPAGTWYGEILQAQLDADGFPAKVWDPEGDDGIGSSDNFDGWYNVSAAKEYLDAAIAELAAQGIEVSAENPIQIDIPYHSGSTTYTNMFQALKKGYDDAFDGKVQINLIGCADQQDWLYSAFRPQAGRDMNYELSFASGWVPDYADPGNYLETMVSPPDGTGYVTMAFGLW